MHAIAQQIEARPRARSLDPAASHAAAAGAARFAKSHAGRILAALEEHGSSTAAEIAEQTGLTVVQIDRRLPELKAAGLADVRSWRDGSAMVRLGYRVWEATTTETLKGTQ